MTACIIICDAARGGCAGTKECVVAGGGDGCWNCADAAADGEDTPAYSEETRPAKSDPADWLAKKDPAD